MCTTVCSILRIGQLSNLQISSQRDRIDVQSFIWVVGAYTEGSKQPDSQQSICLTNSSPSESRDSLRENVWRKKQGAGRSPRAQQPVADDTEKWGKVIRAANIKPE